MESSKSIMGISGASRFFGYIFGVLLVLVGLAGVVLSAVAGIAFVAIFTLVIIIGVLMIIVSGIQILRVFIPQNRWREHRVRLLVSTLYFLLGSLILISPWEISGIFVILISVAIIIFGVASIRMAFSRYAAGDMIRLLIMGAITAAIGVVALLQASILAVNENNGIERFGIIVSLSVMVSGLGLLVFATRRRLPLSRQSDQMVQ